MVKKPIRGAVLDLGSNSFKFMLAEQCGGVLRVHKEKLWTTRLGGSVATTEKLQAEAIRRSLRVLQECRQHAEQFQAESFVAVGTSALRSASNRREFLDPARRVLGFPVRVISGKAEAELIYEGVASHPRWQKEEIVLLDLGGGSLEGMNGKKGRFASGKTLPLGCVRMRDLLLPRPPYAPDEIEKARIYLAQKLRPLARLAPSPCFKLLASGGTMTALCTMRHRSELEGCCLKRATMLRFLHQLAPLSLAQLKRAPRLQRDRADIIVPGLLTLLAAMDVLGKDALYCSTRGLRHGVWRRWIGQPFARIQYTH
ncbi:MAG: hypothetical protein V1746_08200 [bacterium]